MVESSRAMTEQIGQCQLIIQEIEQDLQNQQICESHNQLNELLKDHETALSSKCDVFLKSHQVDIKPPKLKDFNLDESVFKDEFEKLEGLQQLIQQEYKEEQSVLDDLEDHLNDLEK